MTKNLVATRGENRTVLATRVDIAESFVARSKGLLGRTNLPTGDALWIKRCNSIHTFFMKFSIDAIFVDDKMRVVSMHENLRPWRITKLYFKASSVFELPAGTLARAKVNVPAMALRPGDQIQLDSAEAEDRG